MLSPLFDAFVEASPVSVMMRVLMENIFNPSRMDQLTPSFEPMKLLAHFFYSYSG
ncbi:hypothetical protein [Trichormus sp. NMC-1]|uniref:hypothetical protein n=1 Tax=Trichormus sp. NMC-1 TaxID=1853259 RepID=UPI000B0BA655|nr:hypothetical protein [Trichormus sp. NMC-1]